MEDPSLKLKEQVQLICTLLFDEYGEQSIFLSVNPSNQTSTYMGSPQGKEFLQNRMDIIEQFYNQCSGQQLTVPIKSKKDAETMTELTNSMTGPEISPTQDAQRMTESPESANNNKNSDRSLTDVKSRTGGPTDVSLVKTNTVLPSRDKLIRDVRSVSNESFESISDLSQHNKNLGDIFEDEFNGDENSDSGSLIEDKDDLNQKEKNFREGIYSTLHQLESESVSKGTRPRRRSKTQYLRDGYEYIDIDVKTKSGQSNPLKIKIGQILPITENDSEANVIENKPDIKPIRIRQVPARQKEKMFDIYLSGQRMLHSVKEVREHELQTGGGHLENGSSVTERLCGISSVMSEKSPNSEIRHLCDINLVSTEKMSLSALGSTQSGFYVNFHDILEPEIKPVKSGETAEESRIESEPIDIKKRSDGRFICPNCGQSFGRKNAVYWHYRLVHLRLSEFKCVLCTKLFQRSSELRRHTLWHIRKKHIGDTPFICNICLETFPSKQDLKDHMATHTEIPKFVCEHCGKICNTKTNLKSHKRVHELKDVAPRFKCPDPGCHFSFKTQARLDAHLVNMRAEKNFVCEMCGYKTKTKKSFEMHVERKHTENRKPEYFCEQCNKYFFTKRNYIVHVDNHRGKARYVCDCCNMVFASNSTLKRHYLRKAGLYVRPKSKNNKNMVF